MRSWGRSWGALLVAGALSVTGCGPPGEQPWAAEAQAWFEAHDAAEERQDITGMSLYYDAATVSDSAMIDRKYVATGRRDSMAKAAGVFRWDFGHGPLHLSGDGAARTDTWSEPVIGGASVPVLLMLALMRIGEDGIARSTHLAPTTMFWTVTMRQTEAIAAAERIAADYEQAWGTGDAALFRGLYTDDAALADDLLDIEARGADTIAAVAASAPVVAMTNAEVLPEPFLDSELQPAPDAMAVFLYFAIDRPQLPTRVALFVATPDPCPGPAVAVLQIDQDGRIAAERRYRDVEALRGCLDPDQWPTGWWTGRGLPLPFAERITGTIDTASGPVEIRNGTESGESVVRWAMDRFAVAGLPVPSVSSVTFDTSDDRCSGFDGYADCDEGGTAILVCFDASGIGPLIPEEGGDADASSDLPQQGHLMLHELGHAWLSEHVDGSAREEFLALTGLDTWSDKGEPWNRRGVEWAAETLAWGLQGFASTPVQLGSPDCAAMAEGFRLLTGAEPLAPCAAG